MGADPGCADRMSAARPEDFLTLERKVWAALVAGDPAADRQMLSADFLGVYPSGFSDRDGHCGQLAAGPTMSDYRLSEARVREISADAVLLSYRAECCRAGHEDWEVMYISSLWERAGGRWVNTFSQDTPSDPS
jgi:hypothetical protein